MNIEFPIGRDVRISRSSTSRHAGRTGTVLSTTLGVELRIHGYVQLPGEVYPAFNPSECELLPIGWEDPARSALDLEAKLMTRLRDFIRRAAPIVRDENGSATLTIMLHQPGGDEDGVLYMEAEIEERLQLTGEEGRISGVRFDNEGPESEIKA